VAAARALVDEAEFEEQLLLRALLRGGQLQWPPLRT
jgi:hypothetical protein